MLWTNKLSDMENDKIINDSTQPGNEKGIDGAKPANKNGVLRQESTNEESAGKKRPFIKLLRGLFIFICSILVIILLTLFILYGVPGLKELTPRKIKGIADNTELKKDPDYKKQVGLLSKDVQKLSLKFNSYTTGQSYIVVNTTENRFYLYKNKQLIREGSCSTGSYKKLQTESGKSWIFKTPRGKFSIQAKRTHPAWHRPDWSFIEEGSPIPPKDSPLRWETGVLGDYAMDLGDSYMIHGTIYKRFLGMPVTHGCVRLNDEDLEVVFNTLNVGSKVYIF
jgi:lipoprotein-anchoring transpeptidase ErfK/SrfK